MGELRQWLPMVAGFLKFGNLAIAGHALQVVGAFGSLVTPDAEEEAEDFENR